MNILSLFDGISGARVALERVGIKVDNYFASEVDKYAIQIAQHNYPDTVQVGDVRCVTGYTIAPNIKPTKKNLNVSDTQRYKALGNSFTVDVISHILKHLDLKN